MSDPYVCEGCGEFHEQCDCPRPAPTRIIDGERWSILVANAAAARREKAAAPASLNCDEHLDAVLNARISAGVVEDLSRIIADLCQQVRDRDAERAVLIAALSPSVSSVKE